MLPYHSFISWKLGPLTIQSFGLMMALGFLAAIYLFARQFKTEKEKDTAYNIGIITIVFGVLGSRLLYVAQNPGALGSALSFFNFWEGGLSWFGGFFGAVIACAVYIRLKGLNFWAIADKLAPSIALGHAFGRLGCILGDGGHVGKLTAMPWGFDVNGEIRHVTAWYEMIGLLLLFGVLMLARKKSRWMRKGSMFGLYLAGYGVIRFVSDFFRVDPIYLGLTAAQYSCIVMFIAGTGLIAVNLMRKIKKDQ
jgi:phosphatidylglycerol:prolipoprotein diacylglycerol transferase